MSIVLRLAAIAGAGLLLSGCLGLGGGEEITPAAKQLSSEAQTLLAIKGMREEAPIFVRIFKEESELEVWKLKDDGRFHHFRTYPVCSWSGGLGPKVREGDRQAPEGFYTVAPSQMNPHSLYHLAFNLGFPNAYDRANGHSGGALMVHGDCKSAGCFAMTDALIEEIYILAREAFRGGQREFHVQAFPFRMTEANMARHRNSPWRGFWRTLKEGYDSFEASRVPPKVAVCQRQYMVNVNFLGQEARPDPSGPCPAYAKLTPEAVAVAYRSSLGGARASGQGQGQGAQPAAVAASAQQRPQTAASAAPPPQPPRPPAVAAAPPQRAPEATASAGAPAQRPRRQPAPAQQAQPQPAAVAAAPQPPRPRPQAQPQEAAQPAVTASAGDGGYISSMDAAKQPPQPAAEPTAAAPARAEERQGGGENVQRTAKSGKGDMLAPAGGSQNYDPAAQAPNLGYSSQH